jgi:hypothetical protein
VLAPPGWLAFAGSPPHVFAPLGGLAGIGAVSHGGVPRGLLAWLAVGAAGEELASTGGTARKESVISQGGTPVFGRVLPASGFAAGGFAEPGRDAPGRDAAGFDPPGLGPVDSAAPGPG